MLSLLKFSCQKNNLVTTPAVCCIKNLFISSSSSSILNKSAGDEFNSIGVEKNQLRRHFLFSSTNRNHIKAAFLSNTEQEKEVKTANSKSCSRFDFNTSSILLKTITSGTVPLFQGDIRVILKRNFHCSNSVLVESSAKSTTDPENSTSLREKPRRFDTLFADPDEEQENIFDKM